MTPPKVCVELLEEELMRPKPKPTIMDVYNTVLKLAQCFVATTRQVDEIVSFLDMGNNIRYGRRKEDAAGETEPSSFDTFTKWLIDKILPPLLVGAIIMIGQVIMFTLAFMFALTNGWITL